MDKLPTPTGERRIRISSINRIRWLQYRFSVAKPIISGSKTMISDDLLSTFYYYLEGVTYPRLHVQSNHVEEPEVQQEIDAPNKIVSGRSCKSCGAWG